MKGGGISFITRTLCLSLMFATFGYSQENKKTPGLLLIEKGDLAGAIQLLKKSTDLVDLHHLGLAYEKSGKTKEARNAYDRSFRSGYKEFADGIIERSHAESKQPVPAAKLSEYLQTNAARIVITAMSAQRALDLKGIDDNEWAMRAQMIAEIGRILVSNQLVYSANEVDADPTIKAKPRPSYTDEARQSNEQGTVELVVLFDSDGKVKAALPVKKLKYGLTEQAFVAALKMSFTPAQKAGKPIAMLRTTFYTFSIY